MAVPIKNPTFFQWTPRASGDVQTGEVPFIRGGGRCATIYSGALAPSLVAAPGATLAGNNSGHVVLFSGAGRINSLVCHQAQLSLSGVPITFYDSAIPHLANGSPAQSGMKILAPLNAAGGVSGQVNLIFPPIPIDLPFQSGLCVVALSGAPGFTVSFTPEVSTAFQPVI